ncbi:MAG: GTP-binding protein, partial [Oscillospiraceae bacterium]|nr:GTP-binding protein [Oscillospiraceae bacterium]
MPEKLNKTPICMALLAHVDAGKTTLSEAMLFSAGATRRLGRVDHGDAFLDTYALERKRGITIFSKQARFSLPEAEITLLDTPGHVDFSAEAERTLSVLDYAVLVISGTDGVQGHTETLWQLLKTYNIPTFIFVNKMDLAGADEFAIMAQLSARLGDECINFTHKRSDFAENLAMCDERLMEEYLESGEVSDEGVREAIAARRVFPCFFGAALKNEGVEELLDALQNLTVEKTYPDDFSAQIYKIGRDNQGARVSFMKVTGGTLRVKMPIKIGETEEKIDQIRLYSGEKFVTVNEVSAGMVCAVTGLSETFAGQRLGGGEAVKPVLQSVLTYRVIPP